MLTKMRTTTQFPFFQPNAFILNAKCIIRHLKVNTFLCCPQYVWFFKRGRSEFEGTPCSMVGKCK